jgi:hypothetical protein
MSSIVEGQDVEHLDPITQAPGAHPIGVGVGAALGGAAAGAAAGTVVAGPVGTLFGAAIGAVAGGLVGKGVAEYYEPTVVERHWIDRYTSESYYTEGMSYEDYAPAYQLGAARRATSQDAEFDHARESLAADYPQVRGNSRLDWPQAEPAARASWYKIYNE